MTAWVHPNEADVICNRFEMGAPAAGDMIRMAALKARGVVPVYYTIDPVTLAPKRKSPEGVLR